MGDVPEGFFATPPQESAPIGFSEQPPMQSAPPQAQSGVPEGFSEVPPPAGFSFDNPLAPEKTSLGEKTNTEVPGFWSSVGSAFGRGIVQRAADDVAGAQVALPKDLGGKSLEEQFQEGLLNPSTKDEIDNLLAKKVNEGWTDPKWWGVQVAHGTGSMVPAGAAAAAGTLARIPVPITFGAEGGLGALVPAYKKARAEGLDPEAATQRALIDSGISATTAAAMGIAPGISLFGRSKDAAVDVVAGALKRPVMEMLAQLGVVQPGLAVTGEVAKSLTHGESPDPWDLATTAVIGAGMGVVPVGSHAAMRMLRGAPKEVQTPPDIPDIEKAFQNQAAPPGFSAAPPEAGSAPPPDLMALETPPTREEKIFFSPVREAVIKKLPESASVEQVIATIRNTSGVKEEEIMDLGLPQYLADLKGKVSKKDLLTHIEAESVQLQEIELNWNAKNSDTTDWSSVEGRGVGIPKFSNMVAPGEHSNYREFLLKTPAPKIDEAAIEDRAREIWNFNYKQHGSWREASPLDREEIKKRAKQFILDERKDVFTGSHWSVPNVISHFRISDRTDVNGRNLLHVEEIQSDLHQTGQKVGYLEKGQKPFDFKASELRKTRIEQELNLIRRIDPRDFERDTRWRELQRELSILLDEEQLALDDLNKLHYFPFKTSWKELTVKRILRLAADEGYDGISWANGDQIALRTLKPDAVRGNREFYDTQITKLFNYWAKKLGMDGGTTEIRGASDVGEHLSNVPVQRRDKVAELLAKQNITAETINKRNRYIEVNPAASNRIRMGLPLYETEPSGRPPIKLNEVVQKGLPKAIGNKAIPIMKAFDQIAKDMTISAPIDFHIGPRNETWRGMAQKKNGRYQIQINSKILRTTADVYATIGHELGHVIMWDKFALADAEIKTQVFEAFRRFRQQMVDTARTVGDVRRVRDNAISEMTGARNLADREFGTQDQIPLSDLDPRSRSYMVHFEEWFAEQVSKWATTSDRPLSRLDKFFAALGKRIRSIVSAFKRQRPTQKAEAEAVMQGWLDSMISDMAPFASDIKDKHEFDTKRANQDAVDRDGTPQVAASPQTASTVGGRNILRQLPPLGNSSGEAMAAHADRMNRFYEWMTSLPQIAEMNKHIRPLQIYKEVVALMNLEKNNIMGDAWNTLRAWKQLPKAQLDKLNAFIDDYANGLFKLPETADGSIRRPNSREFAALVHKHGLSAQGLKMFNTLIRDFDGFLEKYRGLLLADAARIKDPIRQLAAIESSNRRVDELLHKPFFPIRRFGKYTVTVYDVNNNVRHFETTDSLRKQKQIAEALGKSSDLLPGDRVRTGEVPKDAAPLLGMPAGLIDLIADKLDLSDSQRLMLDQLRFDYAPSQSFKNQFRQRDLTPGYSTDFQRSYAHFFFHGANHMTRVKWVDALRDQIKEVKTGSIDLNDAIKRDKIANYLTQHLKMLVDPKPDFAALRGLMFHWYLGFNPASATLNLSQTPIMTYPHLASKFGDLRSVAALSRAALDLNNFYKKSTIQDLAKTTASGPAGAKLRALSEAVKEGVISETQAHTLAAVSEDRNLLRAFGSKGEEFWQKFSEASSWMFEMTEQYNRRVAFRSAWELAMRDPNNKYVLGTVRDNPLQYKRLRDAGWTHQEAAAFTAAKDSVEKTQFVYAPYARPKFMWGKKGALFIFKSFTQNTLWNLWSNKSAGARSIVILGTLGGLMGLPGTEDVNGILKALAWRLFGKDFDVEDEARKFAVDVLGGKIAPDTLLHGTSVHGFGIPQVMNATGSLVGLEKWFPTLDRHGSIGLGNILPFEPGKLFGPTKDTKTQELAQLQRASGAGFGNLFALYNFLNSQDSLGDLKRWEQIMPRALSNLSHGWRYLHEGEERSRSGATIVKFDSRDTEQMAEILARTMGYQPRRLTAAWEAIGAKQEAATYWDLRKGILFRQFATAVKEGDAESRAKVLSAIRSYNEELPPEAKSKAITAQALKTSIQDRMKANQKTSTGLPQAKSDIPLYKHLDRYFPEGRPTGQVGAQTVK